MSEIPKLPEPPKRGKDGRIYYDGLPYHVYNDGNSAETQYFEDRSAVLEARLRVALEVISQLEEQQAMPDDSHEATVAALREGLGP